MKILKTTALAFAFGLIAIAQSQAVFITGQIQFTGEISVDDGDIANFTTITFSNPMEIENATGTYAAAGVSDTHEATFSSPFVVGAEGDTTGSASPLWTLISPPAPLFSFDLTSITANVVVAGQRILAGKGVAKGTGYDDTPALWQLSTSGTGTTLSISSATTAVPDGGSTAILFGLALLGFPVLRKRLAKS